MNVCPQFCHLHFGQCSSLSLLFVVVLFVMLCYGIHQVSQKKLLQYIHFNRLENRMLIDQLKKEIDIHHPPPPPSVKMLVRKQVDNPADYFDKTYAEYQEGFSANGLFKKQSIQSQIKSLRRELAWS